MGNNLTSSLTQFYSPPTPPTPLSPESYFWIKSGTTGERGGNNNNGQAASGNEASDDDRGASSSSGVREIPVLYIRRDAAAANGNGSDENDSEEATNSNQRQRTTLLYCHGHDVDLGMIHDFLIHLSKFLKNVDIMSFDYAGYGLTKNLGSGSRQEDNEASTSQLQVAGKEAGAQHSLPTEEHCYNDILACFNYLVKEKGVPPRNIILYGKSLGSGPVCWLANKLCHDAAVAMRQKQEAPPPPPPLGGIVLHSAFLSILRLKVGFTVGSIVGDAFDNVGRLQDMHRHSSSSTSTPDFQLGYKLPIYLIHGTDDEVVPFNHGEALYELIMDKRKRKHFPPFWANGGTHWNIEHKYVTAYIKRLQQFIRHCDKANNNGNGNGGRRDKKMAAKSNSRTNSHGIQQHGQGTNSNPTSSRGRSTAHRQSNTKMMHHRARSNSRARSSSHARSSSKARLRRKKGTLVMRGGHDEDEDEDGFECAFDFSGGQMNGKIMHGKTSINVTRDPINRHETMSCNKTKARVVRESRNPP
eukprot:CAMPEP_0172320182 /NCGR_PEP_ID=MMETSP1058-20130122/39872_1 /TAXON_ID=83371 /ORGANISM="Detonula confervacea, Strain CCMP 353" /LENGTH=526 /DNA_ID=CAMNT_0013035395 /DNA_START=194 /DNA_END=1774 /DNA_ORIENTATION=+